MAKYRGHRRIGQVEEESSSPVTQVQTWLAWRGRARGANQVRPGEDFTGAATVARGATPPRLLRLAPAWPPTESQPHHDHHRETQLAVGEAGEEPSAEATEGHFPERDLIADLLGAGAGDKSACWRRERV
jgi:hypothetical protein